MSEMFKPISPNPYVVGNPIRDKEMFFGRKDEFELIRSRFRGENSLGGFIVLCGERRSGKTSILFQVQAGRLGPTFIPVLIDMQSMVVRNERGFLERVADEVRSSLDPARHQVPTHDFSSGTPAAQVFHDFVREVVVRNPDFNLILLVDEFELLDAKIETGVISDDVLGVLSSLMEQHSLYVVFTGSHDLERRRMGRHAQHFIGKSTYRKISYLTRRDTERLIIEPIANRAEYEPGTVDFIVRLTAGQPFYTQAICQSLVDQLNVARSRVVTHALIERVVHTILDNPYPQMTFLWDGLAVNEKQTLALLAEVLNDPSEVSTAPTIHDYLRSKAYVIRLSKHDIAVTLEGLWKRDFLTKDRDGAFAFRMDLWREWIRRAHSVYQVISELKMRSGRRTPLPLIAAATILSLAAIGAVGYIVTRQDHNGPEILQAYATLRAHVLPEHATISCDGRQSTGFLQASLEAGDYVVHASAEGYESRDESVTLVARDTAEVRISLPETLVSLQIRTRPTGATVFVNGQMIGPSPVGVDSLWLLAETTVRAEMMGYEPRGQSIDLRQRTEVEIPLSPIRLEVSVRTTPPNATVALDGDRRVAPVTFSDVPYGTHTVEVTAAGFVPRTEVVDVTQDVTLTYTLSEVPKSYLVVEGDSIVSAYLDDDPVPIVRSNYSNLDRPFEVDPGSHTITVEYPGQPPTRETHPFDVESGELVHWSTDERAVTSREPTSVESERGAP